MRLLLTNPSEAKVEKPFPAYWPPAAKEATATRQIAAAPPIATVAADSVVAPRWVLKCYRERCEILLVVNIQRPIILTHAIRLTVS